MTYLPALALVILSLPAPKTVIHYPEKISEFRFREILTAEYESRGIEPSKSELDAVTTIVKRESEFRPWVYNGGGPKRKRGHSSAFGLFQGLKSTYRNYGHTSLYGVPDVVRQVQFGVSYIIRRHKSGRGALKYWNRHGSY